MAIIIILSILLVVALAYIFYFTKAFFNIFMEVNSIQNNKPKGLAYDGKYYPATVITRVYVNAEVPQIITDFSLYDEKHIVGFFIYTQRKFTDKETALLSNPTIFPNAIVYQKSEGLWTWEELI